MRILKRMRGWLGRKMQVICALATLATAAEATWSIVVVDTATGEVCVATATCLAGLNIANYVPVIVVGEGAAAAQNYVDQSGQNRILIRDALLAGLDPSVILSNLAASDAQHNSRQYGIVSLNGGPPIAYTGTGGGGAKKQVYGEVGTLRYSIQGNVLAGQVVVDAAEAALLETEGDLVTRAMASMQAARFMGGDGRCSCSTLIPTSCGAPPPSFVHSSYTACIIVARDGDVDGSCASSGCANGSYYLRKTITGNAGLPDPVETLGRQVMQWRISKRGRPDHIQTEVLPSATRLPADGLSTSEVTIRLKDIDGVQLTDGGQTFILDDITPGGPIVSLTNQVDHGDGTHTLSFTSGTTPGTARIKISVVHWWEESQLYPYLELNLDTPSQLHLGNEVLSVVDGGEAPLTLNFGAQGAGRPYLLLLSGSGNQPGTPFGGLTLPLNSDRLLDWSLGAPNPGFWPNMNGDLDANGRRLSTLNVAPGALAPFVGGRLDFCALLPGYVTAPVGFDVSP